MKKESSGSIFRDPQNIITLGVVVISTCALAVSIMQTRIMSEQRELMHEQTKAAVWPRLQIDRGKSHRREDYKVVDYKLFISNAGVGPAIVTDVRVTFKGKPVEDWWNLFPYFNLPDSVETFISNSSINQSIFKIGQETIFLDLGNNPTLANYFFENEEHIKIEVWYKSIYGDMWKLTHDNQGAKTEEIESDFALPKEEQFDG